MANLDIRAVRQFLTELTANNSRDWFLENKPRYDADLRAPAEALLTALQPRLSKLTGEEIGTKLFRPNRDVRFSKDKTLYKTHLHVLWTVLTGGRQEPVLFFGISADYVTAGTGIMGFDKGVLEDWRKMVDLDGPRISGIIAAAEAKGFAIRGEPALKRVPSPFDKDHPHGGLLRRKGLTMSGEMALNGTLEDDLMAAFEDLWSVADMLGGIAA